MKRHGFAALAWLVLNSGIAQAAPPDAPSFAGPGNRDCAECPELVILPGEAART